VATASCASTNVAFASQPGATLSHISDITAASSHARSELAD